MKKKSLALALTMAMAFTMAGCGSAASTSETSATTQEAIEAATQDTASAAATEDSSDAAAQASSETASADSSADEKAEGVMTYEEYAAADIDTEVTVETYVQAKQSWWEDKATIYTQDKDGAYFIYNMPCTEDEYAQLEVGTKIKVTGYKSEWSGEVEIVDAEFEIEDGNYVAEPVDVTDKLGADDLINYQNQCVSFTGMTVEAADDNGAAFLYGDDGTGAEGDDLYFKVSSNGETYTFTVESYLTDKDSDVYKAVEGLKVGDTVDMTGFLYWYEGVNPHITSVTVK